MIDKVIKIVRAYWSVIVILNKARRCSMVFKEDLITFWLKQQQEKNRIHFRVIPFKCSTSSMSLTMRSFTAGSPVFGGWLSKNFWIFSPILTEQPKGPFSPSSSEFVTKKNISNPSLNLNISNVYKNEMKITWNFASYHIVKSYKSLN